MEAGGKLGFAWGEGVDPSIMELPKSKLIKKPTESRQQAECCALLNASCWFSGLLFNTENGDSKVLQNDEFLADYIVSQPRKKSMLVLYSLFQFLC
jgi:hypothetical protein